MSAAPHPTTDEQLAYTGTLLANAQARQKPIDTEGHLVPVVMFDIATDSALRMPMHIEQYYPAGQMFAAETAAHRLHKGTRITVYASVLAHRLSIIASHIQAEQVTPSTPCQLSL